MLARHGRSGAALEDQKLIETYTAQLQRVRTLLARRPELRILSVNYADLLANPTAGIGRLAQFLGAPFNSPAAAESVQPQLRRQKA